MEIGSNIRSIRKQKGLTQKQLGEILGVSQAAVGQFENNKSVPQVKTLEKIANALGVPTSQLLGEDYMIDDGFMFIFDDENDVKETKVGKFVVPSKRKTLLDTFSLLNTDGQDKVIQYTKDISENPKYKKDPDNQDQE